MYANECSISKSFYGFFAIPGYTRYLVNQSGEVYSLKTKTFLQGSFNPDGYLNFRLTDDHGLTKTWGRHRLLCFVFKYPGYPIEGLCVNHINGIKGDDRLENLEWVTYTENIEHAGLNSLTEKCKPVLLRNFYTGEILQFPSVTKCAKFLEISKDAVLYRIQKYSSKICKGGFQYKFLNSVSEQWADPENIKDDAISFGREKRVMTLNLLSGEQKIFNSLKDAAAHTGLSQATLSINLQKGGNMLLPGFFLIQDFFNFKKWKSLEEACREHNLNNKQKVVKSFCPETEKTVYYYCQADCAEKEKIGLSTLNYWLKNKNGQVVKNGKSYTFNF